MEAKRQCHRALGAPSLSEVKQWVKQVKSDLDKIVGDG